MPLCGEGLNHVEAIHFLPKIGRGELRTSACVEHDALGDAPELDCIPQCIARKLLGKQISTSSGFLFCISGSRRFYGAHLGAVHLFHQSVHPTFTDGYAIITCETDSYFASSQAFIGFGIDFQDFLLDFHIFLLPAGSLTIDKLVISTSVDVQNPAKDRNAMLSRQCLNSLSSLSACGVKIAMAFF